MKEISEDILNCPILIIEDDFLGRTVLKEIFRKHGFTNIEEAENGIDGIKKIKTFRPYLVVLDVLMPEMNGIDCCKEIRRDKDPQISNVPILFQTSLDSPSEKATLFAAGATDYLSKPIDPNELAARAVVHLEREVMLKHLTNFNNRMAEELNIARTTQMVLIPQQELIKEIEQDYKLQIFGHYQACSELGGDFWGFKSLSNEELAIYMVDFSGHGVNAALNVFRVHALMQAAMSTAYVPGAYLTNLNAHLAPLLPSGQFATMFYGIINTKKSKLTYASAGSPEPILFKADRKHNHILQSTGTVIGAVNDATFNTVEVEFNKGDSLFTYSDALIETEDKNGNMLPIEYWVDFCQSRINKNNISLAQIFEELLNDFKKKSLKNIKDDLTLSFYSRNP